MKEHHDRALSILADLGSRPAAPFFEDGPAGYITEVLARLDVTTQRDTYGNIVAHYSSGSDGSQPPVAFVAHMDHPGFEIVSRVADGTFTARALGGVPAASLRKPTPVLVLTADRGRAPAEMVPIAASTPEQAAEVARVADAAVVGSALVQRVSDNLDSHGGAGPGVVPAVVTFVRGLAHAVAGRDGR